MSERSSSKNSPITLLFIVAGVILLLAGALSLLPSITTASEVVLGGAPADFGEEVLPLRPTVTPPPFASQITPAPVLLPDNSEQPRPTSVPGSPVPTPTPVNLTDGVPTRLVIPAIKLDAPIEKVRWHTVDGVSQWDVPDHFAAGWLMTSAPLGKPGNTALTGHHNIDGEVFRNLVKLQPGDRITIYSNDQPFYYEVQLRRILPERGQSDEVRRENARWIQPTTDERITLITCWPYTSNTHRLIIVAKPIAPEKANQPIEP
ncbi:MAG TPA: sortase [Anaerolineae bacterium]|nr:sortase [Anaerolineae bacterium]